jgi:predicted transcriptional regulator
MTKQQIAILLDRIETLPKEAQDEIASAILAIASRHEGTYRLSQDERAAVDEGWAQAEAGEFAPEAEMDAFFRRP